jgi:hypothetical protein
MNLTPIRKPGKALPPDGTLARRIHRLKVRVKRAGGRISSSLFCVFVLMPAAILFGLGLWLKIWKLDESEACECGHPSPDDYSQLLEACLNELKKTEGQAPRL